MSHHKSLSIAQKKEIINIAEQSEITQVEIAKQYGVSKSAISRTLKNKRKILDRVADGIDPNQKRMRVPNIQHENTVLAWFKNQRNANIPVSGPILQKVAVKFASELGLESFKASNGWLERFKKRHDIRFKSVEGEAGSVDVGALTDWQVTVLHQELRNFEPKNIFNVDEFGLFWKMLPNRTLAMPNDRCTSGKKSKDRLTVLVGANMDGTEKIPLLVIGKSTNPRAFKGKTLPVNYKSNSKAWMTGALFIEWLKNWDKKLRSNDRRILLYVDNCPSHPNINEGLTHITLKFLPANTTSLSQPMDQGVIRNLKFYYRQTLLTKIIDNMDNGNEFQSNLLSTLWMLKSAWEKVSTSTIAACFHHARFTTSPDSETDNNNSVAVESINEERQEWDHVFNQEYNLNEFLYLNEDLATSETAIVIENPPEIITISEENPSSDEEELEIMEPPNVDIKKVMEGLSLIQLYLEQHAEPDEMEAFNKLEEIIRKKRLQSLRQTNITQFFR